MPKRSPAVISWNLTCCLASASRVQPKIFGTGPPSVSVDFSSYSAEIVSRQHFPTRVTLRRIRTVMIFPFFHVRVGLRITKNWSIKGLENFIIQGKDYQEKIDNSTLVVRFYNHDSCIPAANFFIINLPTGCTEDVRAQALIPHCNTPVRRVRRCYCDVFT